MSDAQRVAFTLAAGIDPGAMLLGIASVVLVLAMVWALWVTFGAFRSWQDGSAGLFDLTWSVVRVCFLLMALGFYIR